MLEDSQARLIVTSNQSMSLLNEFGPTRCSLLNIDEISSGVSADNVRLSPSPEAIAYIMYTSGSTGQSKGVIQNHRNILHKVMTHTNDYHISPDDRVALLYSCSYSASVRPIFGALLNGAALFPLDVKREGPASVVRWLRQENITLYFSVPTLFRHVVDTLQKTEEVSSVRLIYLGGEPVTREHVGLFKKNFSTDCILVNSMASNETGTALQYFVDKATEIEGSVVPAGYRVSAKEILLLPQDGETVGSRGIGEIAVRSRYLSPGYWRRPGLTRNKFLPDPTGGGSVFI